MSAACGFDGLFSTLFLEYTVAPLPGAVALVAAQAGQMRLSRIQEFIVFKPNRTLCPLCGSRWFIAQVRTPSFES